MLELAELVLMLTVLVLELLVLELILTVLVPTGNNRANLKKVCSEQTNRLLQKEECGLPFVFEQRIYSPLNVTRHIDVSFYWFDADLVGWEGEQINTI